MVSPLGESGNLVPMVSLIDEVLENIGELVIHCFRKTAVRDVNESGSTVSTNKNCLLQRSVKDSQKKEKIKFYITNYSFSSDFKESFTGLG